MTSKMADKSSLEMRKIDLLYRRDEIEERVLELGEQISRDYADTTPILIGALKGCFVFMADLARAITIPLEIEFISAASYRSGTQQDDTIAVGPSPMVSLKGRDVIFVEGVVDSGKTAEAIIQRLKINEPNSIEVATLLHKTESSSLSFPLKYVGFEVANLFVVGYGLDYSQLYRNLNFIGHVSEFDK